MLVLAERNERVFDPTARAVGCARRYVVTWLGELGLGSWIAELLVSELATNAVEHARTPFRVRMCAEGDDVVRLEVEDSGPGQPEVQRGGAIQDRGRGLLIVERLALDWGVAYTGGAKQVWARIGISAGEHPITAPPTPGWS